MKFSLTVLGGASLEGADGPVRGRAAHKRRVALLAVLASARGRAVSRERILGLLWPETSSQAGRHLLSESLSVVRRELGNEAFVCQGDDLFLNREVVASDIDAFEAALERGEREEAAALYRGPFLDGFYVSGAPGFERWAEDERARIGRAYARALEELAESSEAERAFAVATDWWRRLAVHDPYSSRVSLRLVQALTAAGEREAALRHAAVHAAFLREELGTEPSVELCALVEQLRHSPPPTVSAEPAARELGTASDAPVEHVSTPTELPSPRRGSTSDILAPQAGEAPSSVGSWQTADDIEPCDERRGAAVWFADIVNYTTLIEREPAAARAVLDVLQDTARREVRRGDGHLVEFIGDGVLAEFHDLASCARAGVHLVRAFERRTHELGAPSTLRIGVHFGSISTTDDGGIYGEAITVATGLLGRAEAGQVIASAAVRRRLQDLPEFQFAARGLVSISGMAAPVQAYDLRLKRLATGKASIPAPAVADTPVHVRRVPLLGQVAAVLGVAMVIGVGALLYRRELNSTPSSPRLDPNRVAILYLSSNSPDPDLRALAKGLTDQLIHELSQVEVLDVVPPSGVRPYRDRDVPLDSVAFALRAGTLLEGSLERSGERLKLTLYLIDASSGERLRTKVLQARVGDPFVLEDQLAQEAARFLRWWLGRTLEVRTSSSGTRSVSARRLVLRAEQAREDALAQVRATDSLNIAIGLRRLAFADSLLIKAEAADPRWAEPVTLRGWIAMDRYAVASLSDQRRILQEAVTNANRALTLRPGDPRALELRGNARWILCLFHQHPAEAERLLTDADRDLQAAVEVDPLRATAWNTLSQLRRVQGDHQGAYLAAEEAYRADAYLLKADVVRDRQFRSALAFGRPDLASRHCLAGAREFPDNWRFVECRLVILATVDTGRADVAAASAVVAELTALDPPNVAQGSGREYSLVYRKMLLAAVLARAGERDSARAVLARAHAEVKSDPESRASFAYDEAHVLLFLGDRPGAIEAIRELLSIQPQMRRSVANDHLFRMLRAEPAFRAAVTPD